MLVASAVVHAQTAATLSQVKKIYIEPFTGKRGAEEIRNEVANRLKHDSALMIVSSAAQSDAILKGNGEIWTTGYISTNPRASSSSRTPVYSGYLSLTLEGGDAQPLWSCMVTPSGSPSAAITVNLADHAARLLVAAREKDSAAPPATPGIPAQGAVRKTLHGAGGTFPAPLYQAWFESFHEIHPEIRIHYDEVGSEDGTQRLLARKVDFAASEVPTSPEGAALQRFATVLGAVVPIYNLGGLDRELRFTPEILAGIYSGKITRWDDAEIRAANHGVSLPSTPIAVVHRSDGSGTTYAFTEFLAKTSPAWKSAVGAGSNTIQWPVGAGAKGNMGVATAVEKTPNSIGYVELTYAIQRELRFGSVRNAAGAFVTANLDSIAAAAQSGAKAIDAEPSITNAPGKAAYPIASFSWIVVPEPVPADDRGTLLQMLQWMLTAGQKQSSALGYAPLPRELASRELQALAQLK